MELWATRFWELQPISTPTALGNARRQARCVVCGTNLGSVGKAFQFYLAENRSIYPPSYIYPSNADGWYELENQPPDHP